VVSFFVHRRDKSTHGAYRTKYVILNILMERQEVAGEEVCLNPQRFIAYLSDKGIEAYEDLAMARRIT
jgi:hypothetical protein